MLIRLSPAICLLFVAACGQDSADAPAAPAAAAPAAAPAIPAGPKPAPAGAMAYIISPADGAVVSSPVHVVFGLRGIGVAPAGVPRTDAGHHHLLVDTGLPPAGVAIPSDPNHRHFGGGQTEADIELAPGMHTLQLLLGDENHVPHVPPITSAQITIEVR